MPVMLRSQVKTMPCPHIVVRNVRDEKARAMLGKKTIQVYYKHERGKYAHKSRNGYSSLINPAKDARCIARVSKGHQHA